jgi:hypothetical protein
MEGIFQDVSNNDADDTDSCPIPLPFRVIGDLTRLLKAVYLPSDPYSLVRRELEASVMEDGSPDDCGTAPNKPQP